MFATAITFPNQHCFVICKANYTQLWTRCQEKQYSLGKNLFKPIKIRNDIHLEMGYIRSSKQNL